MPDLDFSALNKIAYQGFNTEQEKDSLIEQGFTILPGEKTPFETSEPPPAADPRSGSPPQISYKKLFRAAFVLLMENQPPARTLEYWEKVTQQAAEAWNQAGRSPFAMALIMAIFDELERQQPEQAADGEN